MSVGENYSMCSCDIFHVVDLMDPDTELLIDHQLEELSRIMLEFVSCEDVIDERWPSDLCVLCG